MNGDNNRPFLGLAGVATAVVIMLFFMILDNGEAEGIKNDPIGYLHGNSVYALEHTHIIEGALFGAIHNISNETLFVQVYGSKYSISKGDRSITSFMRIQ